MKKYFILALCSFAQLVFAQELGIEWKLLLGGRDTDAGHSITYTADDGFMVAASSQSVDGDVMDNYGDYDIWLVKLSHSGQVEWSKTYGGSDWEWPNSVIQTSDGGYLVVGFTYSDDIDVSGFHGFRDGWVFKVDPNGILQWQRSFGGTEAETIQDAVEVSDGYIFAGHQNSTDGDLNGRGCQSDFWIIKTDYDGNIMWQKCYGGSGLDFPNAISRFGEDKLLIAGYTDSSDGDVTGYHDSYDYWVISINLDGDLLWEKALGGSSWDQAYDIVHEDINNRIYIVGESLSEDGDISMNHGDTDYWVVCLNGDGDLIFEKSYGGSNAEHAKSILLSDLGKELFIFGSAASSDGDVEGNHGNHDMWVVNTDFMGVMKWNKSIGGSRFEQIISSTHSIGENQMPDGMVIVGHTNSNDGDVEGYKGDDDVWVIKLGDASTSISDRFTGNETLSVFPNPATGFITVNVAGANQRIDHIAWYDIYGRKLKDVSVGAFSMTMNVKNTIEHPGVYFLEVRLSSGINIVKRIIIQ